MFPFCWDRTSNHWVIEADFPRLPVGLLFKGTDVSWRIFTENSIHDICVHLTSYVTFRAFFAAVVCVAVVATIRDARQNAYLCHEQGKTFWNSANCRPPAIRVLWYEGTAVSEYMLCVFGRGLYTRTHARTHIEDLKFCCRTVTT